MSILDAPIEQKENLAKRDADNLILSVRNSLSIFLSIYEQGLRTLWSEKYTSDNIPYGPAEILKELGPRATEVFILTGKFTDFLESIKPGCALSILQKYYKPVKYNPDGTIELDNSPTPQSSPVSDSSEDPLIPFN